MDPFELHLGNAATAHVRLAVLGFEHPEVAEPDGLDLLLCRIEAGTPAIAAAFELSLRTGELRDLRRYLAEINSGNGPPATFALAGGLLELAFAPSRRGPVLTAVRLSAIDASHARLEFVLALEPPEITRAVAALERLPDQISTGG